MLSSTVIRVIGTRAAAASRAAGGSVAFAVGRRDHTAVDQAHLHRAAADRPDRPRLVTRVDVVRAGDDVAPLMLRAKLNRGFAGVLLGGRAPDHAVYSVREAGISVAASPAGPGRHTGGR